MLLPDLNRQLQLSLYILTTKITNIRKSKLLLGFLLDWYMNLHVSNSGKLIVSVKSVLFKSELVP